jgi:hypothetical protein
MGDIECEVLFRGLDDTNDVRRLLSLQASFAVFDEFREINKDVFEAMQGRLGRYPDGMMVPHRPSWGVDDKGNPIQGCVTDDGKPNDHLWGMSNPPDFDTFWEKILTDPPENTHVTIQPSGLSEEADWIHLLKSNYYDNLMKGKTEEYIDVYIHAKFGKSLAGQPVYKSSFTREFHVAKDPIEPIMSPDYPIIIGLDFGRTPSAIFKQRDPRGRVLTLSEVTATNMGIETFIELKLMPHISNHYPGFDFVCAPDPAGFMKQQMNELTLVDALKAAGFRCVKPPTNKPEYRIQAVERLLGRQVEGKAMYLIDPRCTTLIKGFISGYRYKQKRNGILEDAPEKNEYSHCFVAGTLVMTPAGEVDIETLAPGDFVMTRQGPREVLGVMGRLSTDLVSVTAGGRTVVCTADHPFIVGENKVRADALQYVNILLPTGENSCDHLNTSQSISRVSGIIKNQTGIINAITRLVGYTCTALFGHSTTAPSPKASTYTTKITTKKTTTSATSRLSRLENIAPITAITEQKPTRKPQLPTWRLFVQRLVSGINLMPGGNGILTTVSELGLGRRLCSLSVATAGESTTVTRTDVDEGFARLNVNQPRAVPVGSITSQGTATIVGIPLSPTNTQKLDTVAAAADIAHFENAPATIVYDITVADEHEFFAAGMLVSNCHDANQYADLVIDMNIRGVGVRSGRREVKRVSYAYS